MIRFNLLHLDHLLGPGRQASQKTRNYCGVGAHQLKDGTAIGV